MVKVPWNPSIHLYVRKVLRPLQSQLCLSGFISFPTARNHEIHTCNFSVHLGLHGIWYLFEIAAYFHLSFSTMTLAISFFTRSPKHVQDKMTSRLKEGLKPCRSTNTVSLLSINPTRTCTARVEWLLCLSVCLSVCLWMQKWAVLLQQISHKSNEEIATYAVYTPH